MSVMASTRGKAARGRKAATPTRKRSAAKPAARRDGYENDVTGIGTSRDKTTYGDYVPGTRRSAEWLDELYHHNDIAATIVDAVPDDAMRMGVDLVFPDDAGGGIATAVSGRMRDLGAEEKITEAWAWGRKSGLGAVHIGVEDGRAPEEPLDLTRVTAVRFLTVYDKRELRPVAWYQDPLVDPKFGRPSLYEIVPDAVRIGTSQQAWSRKGRVAVGRSTVHESRMILFGGARTSRRQRLQNDDTDHSILQRCVDVLLEFGGAWGSVVHMMNDASQFTMGVDNFAGMIANGKEETLRLRALTVDFFRSVARAVPYDAKKETLAYVERSFAGISDVIRWLFQRVCATARTPMTRLFGMSPAGLNATGDSDRSNWLDTIEAERRKIGVPAVETLARILAVEQGATPGIVNVKFPSLWSMSPIEEAGLRKSVADADAIYVDKQVLLPEEIALSRFGAEGWRADTHIDLGAREKMLDAELERAVDDAKNPPPPPPQFQPPTPGGPAVPPKEGATEPPQDKGAEDAPEPDPEADPKKAAE